MTEELSKQDDGGDIMPVMGDLGQIDPGDIQMPRLVLAQGQSEKRPDSIDIGHWYNTVTEEDYGKEVWIIPIQQYKTRVLFGESMGDDVRCRSIDAIVPHEAEVGPEGPHGEAPQKTCAACAWSKFPRKTADGKLPYKPCAKVWNFLVTVIDDSGTTTMAVASFKRTAVKFAKQVISTTTMLSLGTGRLIYSDTAWKVGSGKESGGGNTWLVPTCIERRRTTDQERDQAAMFGRIWQKISGRVRAEHAAQESDDSSDDVGEGHVSTPVEAKGSDGDDEIPF